MRLVVFAIAVAIALFDFRPVQAHRFHYHYQVLTQDIKDPMLIAGIKAGGKLVHEADFHESDWDAARALFTDSMVQGMDSPDRDRHMWPGAACVIDGSVSFSSRSRCQSEVVQVKFYPADHNHGNWNV